MKRRSLLGAISALPLLAGARHVPARPAPVRPGEAGWPTAAQWRGLASRLKGGFITVRSPLVDCAEHGGKDSAILFARLKNPYYIGDEPALTQTLGWTGAWTSRPSVYAVAAADAADVAAAIDFARQHRVRLVTKGGGHSYVGNSNAPDSLLLWTRRMDAIDLHDDFVGRGCPPNPNPVPAVSIGAGALWGRVYGAVAAKAGRYVQGGGCLTVGVAGFVLGGGFGSLSKAYGTGAANLLEAEIVTADGKVRTVNASTDPDLFYALKGGGGGSFGIVTRLTLRTHDLPKTIGAVQFGVTARSDAAYRALVDRVLGFYADALFNPDWGEQLVFRRGRHFAVAMVFRGLDEAAARAVWKPFLDWLAAHPDDYGLAGEPLIAAIPAARFWDPGFLRTLPGVVLGDDRPGAPAANIFWASNRSEAGQVLNGYQSTWMPAALLDPARRAGLVDAVVAASSEWTISLHMNKGLAGGDAAALAASRTTATNPKMLDAFALLICAAEQDPAYPGIPGHEPDLATGRREAAAIARAMAPIRRLVPDAGSYMSETDYHEPDWQRSFWGANYPRLLAAKRRYDPDDLFKAHHGVGDSG